MIEIPLSLAPSQEFSITLNGGTYDIGVNLNSRTGVWSLSLSQNGVSILSNVALLGGVDVFGQYNIPIKNAYVVNLDDLSSDPTKEDLGTASKLFILDDSELISE